MIRRLPPSVLLLSALAAGATQTLDTDLLIVGGDEAGSAAAVQAARLGVKRIALVNDIDWLGGQFSVAGIGPVDEWTLVNGKRTNFPRSGAFLEIVERVRAHNRRAYGLASPGNGWCGTETIEPKAAAAIFEEWLSPYAEKGTGQIRILRRWEPVSVEVTRDRIVSVTFARPDQSVERLRVRTALTMDSSDWGDVIRLSGAKYLAGPDLRARFGEPSAPERLEPGGNQEMNPISWCPVLREAGRDSTIPKPASYDPRSFASMAKVPPFVDWDGSGGIYYMSGWSVYTHRRLIDRRHFNLGPGTEMTVLNWPAHDYPLSQLPRHVAEALERSAAGASKKNIVDLTPAQRRIVYDDVKRRSLEFLYYLQTDAHERVGDFPESFRYMKLTDEYGTADHLPPKPYIREGLRLEALYMIREQDVRTPSEAPMWARAMPPDAVFGYQFNIDFHPTRRRFSGGDPDGPWQPEHVGTRNWSAHTDRAVVPLRSLVPIRMDGLLGCSKNIGVSSLVQASLRLHGQMMHVGQAGATVAWMCLRDRIQPRDVAASPKRWREVQLRLAEGAGGYGTLIWPWHDLAPDAPYFVAANMLGVARIWQQDPGSLFFDADRTVTRRELARALVRLVRASPQAPEWPSSGKPRFTDVAASDPERAGIEALAVWSALQDVVFRPEDKADWGTLHGWLTALNMPAGKALLATTAGKHYASLPLSRADCVQFLYRVLQQRGEWFPEEGKWLKPGGDDDRDGRDDYNDPLPFDRDNNNVPDRLEPPSRPQVAAPFGRRILVSDYGGNRIAIVAADGTIEWTFPAELPQDVWMLKNGNILFSHVRGAREVTPDKRIVWEYRSPDKTEVHGCQPLPDGKVLVVEGGTRRLVEVTRDGSIFREIPVPVKTTATHNQMRGARRTSDGRYLISAKGDRAILELSPDGRLLREIKVPGDPHEVRELPDGHLLVACGEGEALVELDGSGAVIWKLGTRDVPNNPLRLVSGFQRLPDGHTIVVNWLGHGHLGTTAQSFEIDRDKHVVRQFGDHGSFTSINKVQALDIPGDPAANEVLR
jgi:hypothetical protein